MAVVYLGEQFIRACKAQCGYMISPESQSLCEPYSDTIYNPIVHEESTARKVQGCYYTFFSIKLEDW
jgi:hypothetical protein